MRPSRLTLLAFASPALAQPAFFGTGDLAGGGFFSECLAISRDGAAAFGDSVTGGAGPFNSITSAFRFSETLQWLDQSYASISTFALAANADGTAAAGYAVIVPLYDDIEIFRWTPAGGIQVIGDIPGGLTNSTARGISADGSVIVGFGSSAASVASCGICQEAFLWSQATGFVGLSDLQGGNLDSRAYGVSGNGQVIVGAGTSALGTAPVMWAQGIHNLGYLPQGAFAPQGAAYAVNFDGSAIVGFSSSANGISEAFKWDVEGMHPLGDLPGGPFQSAAWALSDDGATVVGQATVEGGPFGGQSLAFIWDPVRGMRDLKQVLTDAGLNLAGWTLTSARGISADGVVICGIGINPSGYGEGWIARLPRTPCYPNCDQSTNAPTLNVADFVCFLNKFNAGDTYANCDGVCNPCLTVLDFICFINSFAAGCS